MTLLKLLPNELVDQILSDLPNPDLASACCVCRRLYHIALPLLYREPHLTTTDQQPTSLELFLRTLLTPACEYFGSNVRCLTIEWTRRRIRLDEGEPPFLAAARSRFALGDARPPELMQVILLLRLVPRLEALHLPIARMPLSLMSSINPVYQLETIPPTLRDFTYQWNAATNWINAGNLLSLLGLPRIRSIVIPGWFESGYTAVDAGADAAGTSSLTHLMILSGSMGVQPLRNILSIPRALAHFVYRPAGIAFNFSFASFALALHPLKHSLISLELDFRVANAQVPSHLPPTTIGSLRDWPALRSLTCTLRMLLEKDSRGLAWLLPAGIRELRILDDVEPPLQEAVNVVVELMAVKEVVPALEMVRVYEYHMKSKRLRKRLKKACWAAGVGL
ncbi:hypothetical protein Q9L58_001515 [Maublancomyces gigas]|uniref:F-box domain-containing protein n=1 Tax=Discina gigas TaxID=1032678 RepID=A0ABR3GU64_9PEZI